MENYPRYQHSRFGRWGLIGDDCRDDRVVVPPYPTFRRGAAYGTAKSGVGIASMGVMRPELVMKSIVPVVMAGVLGIYGLIIAVIISTGGKSCHCNFLSCFWWFP